MELMNHYQANINKTLNYMSSSLIISPTLTRQGRKHTSIKEIVNPMPYSDGPTINLWIVKTELQTFWRNSCSAYLYLGTRVFLSEISACYAESAWDSLIQLNSEVNSLELNLFHCLSFRILIQVNIFNKESNVKLYG